MSLFGMWKLHFGIKFKFSINSWYNRKHAASLYEALWSFLSIVFGDFRIYLFYTFPIFPQNSILPRKISIYELQKPGQVNCVLQDCYHHHHYRWGRCFHIYINPYYSVTSIMMWNILHLHLSISMILHHCGLQSILSLWFDIYLWFLSLILHKT